MDENLNLNNFITHQKYQIKINSENFEDPKDAAHRKWKEKFSFFFVMFSLIGVLIGLFIYIFVHQGSAHEGIALTGVISIALGMAGYYLKG